MAEKQPRADDLKEVPASDILDKIKEGLPVNYDNIKMINILDISGLNLPRRHITSSIKLTNSELDGIAGFSNAIFEHGVNFNGSKFNSDADFGGSQFIGTADFEGSQFSGSALFCGAKIKIKDQTIHAQKILEAIEVGLGVDCDNVIIADDMDLNRLKHVERKKGRIFRHFQNREFYGRCGDGLKVINSSLEFNNTTFLGKLNFSCCQFKNDVDFWICALNRDAVFERSLFCGNAQLNRVNFQKYSIFSGAQFCRDAEFWGSIFSLGPDFSFAGFKSSANFWKAEFKDDADFRNATFNGEVSFECAKINSMDLDAKFKEDSTITLRESNFHTLRVPWNLIKDRLKYSATTVSSKMLIDDLTYLSLTKKYNEMGWFDDADSCYLAYKKLLKKKDLSSLSSLSYNKVSRIFKDNVPLSKKLYNFIKEIYNAFDTLIRLIFYYISFAFYGHGVRLRMPFITGAGLILLSAIIYTYGCQASSFWPRGLIISAKAFIGIAQLQSESLTGSCEYWSIFERLLGSILLVTFTLVLAKKTLR